LFQQPLDNEGLQRLNRRFHQRLWLRLRMNHHYHRRLCLRFQRYLLQFRLMFLHHHLLKPNQVLSFQFHRHRLLLQLQYQ
jgi:hypothetical protein